MSKAMIITVGTGKTVANGICASIKTNNPDQITFIVTEESRDKTLPIILERIKDKKVLEHIISDEENLESTEKECRDAIISCGQKPEDITIDYTSGTKTMTAGLVYAGIRMKVGNLCYVTGKRDPSGIVINGTERCITFPPNRIYSEILFEKSVELFNKCEFESCLGVLEGISGLTKEPEICEKTNVLKELSVAYNLWDKFQLADAYEKLKNVIKDNVCGKIMHNLRIKDRVKTHVQILSKEIEEICEERVIDTLENARRRGEIENKYDDAVARLYRVIEFMAQVRLYEIEYGEIDKKDGRNEFIIKLDKITPEIMEKFGKNKEGDTLKLGLDESYSLLNYLGDELGKIYFAHREEIIKILKARNSSILAHGFEPIGQKGYNKFYEFTKDLIIKIYKGSEILLENLRFPEIKIQ